jgi:DNA-binding IscR family transcriptional regulator
MEAIDGPIGITPCERGSSCEQLDRCSVKDPLMAVRAKMIRILGDTSIYELAG